MRETYWSICKRELHIPPKLLVHVLTRMHFVQELHDRLEAGLARRERDQRVPIALRLDEVSQRAERPECGVAAHISWRLNTIRS